jgi:hypothetical protein
MNTKAFDLHGFLLEFGTFEDPQMYIKEFIKLSIYHNMLLSHLLK